MSWEKIKLGLWSAIGGAILLSIVGFSWGGWVTGGTAQERAAQMTATAMVERLAPLCLMRFSEDPEKDQKFEELKRQVLGRDEHMSKNRDGRPSWVKKNPITRLPTSVSIG